MLFFLLDDLEIEFLAKLETTQDEMMKKLSVLDQEMTQSNENLNSKTNSKTKEPERKISTPKWKNWSWKSSGKAASIEDDIESPKKMSPKHGNSPAESPKHKKLAAFIDSNINTQPFKRKKEPLSHHDDEMIRLKNSECRLSAGARLYNIHDDGYVINDDDDNSDNKNDEMQYLLSNGRPASIHILPSNSFEHGNAKKN